GCLSGRRPDPGGPQPQPHHHARTACAGGCRLFRHRDTCAVARPARDVPVSNTQTDRLADQLARPADRTPLIALCMGVCLVLAFFASIAIGAVSLSPGDV